MGGGGGGGGELVKALLRPPYVDPHKRVPVGKWKGELALNPIGFTPLFEPRSGHLWESQVLLTDGQVVFPRVLGFRPPLMNDRLDISEIFLKGP